MDSQITLFFYHLASGSSFLTFLTRFFSNWAIPILAILLLVIVWKKGIKLVIHSYLSVAIAYAISQIISLIIHRSRPFVVLGGQIKPLVEGSIDSSFPSDHTVIAFALATVLALNIRKKWVTIVLYIVASLVAISRLAAGVHYPTDIIGGALIGILVPWLWLKETNNVEKQLKPK